MIKVQGHDFWRGGMKIGYIVSNYIYDHDGTKLGYSSGNNVYDMSGRKLAFLDGNYIYFVNDSHKMRIEDNEENVVGGDLTNVEKAAASILLGE